MIAASRCNCLVCRLEGTLITELGDAAPADQFHSFTVSSTVLSSLPTPFALIRELHDHSTQDRSALADELILNILNRFIKSYLLEIYKFIFIQRGGIFLLR